MLTTVYGGQGTVADSLIPPGMPGHQEGIGLKYDVAGAKAELAQALTELGLQDGVSAATSRRCRSASTPTPATSFRRPTCRTSGATTSASRARSTARPSTSSWSSARPASSRSPGTPGARTIRTRTTCSARCSGARAATTTRGTRTRSSTTSSRRPALSRISTKSIALYNQAQELLVQDAPAVFTRWRVSNYEVEPWVQGVQGTAQDSVVIGDYFYENISIAQH